MNKSRPTQNKRAREQARQRKQQGKMERRAEASRNRQSNTSPARPGEDPDIAGIVPGPQARPWDDDLPEFKIEGEETPKEE